MVGIFKGYFFKLIFIAIGGVLLAVGTVIAPVRAVYQAIHLPACTYAVICVFCYINKWIMSTRLGQNMRTVGQYITTRIHQADSYAGVSVEDFCGTDAVVITEQIDGDMYKTWLYCYDGYLMELFGMDDIMLMPEDGEAVLKAEDIKFSLEDDLLKADISVKEGESYEVCVYIRSGEGALYEK